MSSQRDFIAQVGFLTFAHNTIEVNYLELAAKQAHSIKRYMPNMPVAVIVDAETAKCGTNVGIFDRVIVLDHDLRADYGVFANELQAFALTPFKETIKLESDLVLTRNIKHWIYGFRHHDILMPTHVVNFRNETVTDTVYRNFFIENKLPNIYTGIYYFRYSAQANNFFRLVSELFCNWRQHRNNWRHSSDAASTDVVFAIAAQLFGVENCTNPALSYPTMVHMKGALNNLPANADWTEHLYSQLNSKILTVGFNHQVYPFHYHQKHWGLTYDK